MTKVSVVVPTFNRALYLKQVINSVLNQTFKDFELIIVDNASSDNTIDIVKSYNDERIKYYRNDVNVGMTNNYNLTLTYASGDYVCMFSDDDVMHPHNLANKVSVLDKYPCVSLVHSNVRVIDDQGHVNSESHWANRYYEHWLSKHKKNRYFKGLDYLKILTNFWNIICMPSVMIRRSVIDIIGDFDVNIYYTLDWDMWVRACVYGDVYYLKEALVDYRAHPKNTIKEITNEKFLEELSIIKSKIIDLLLKKGYSNKQISHIVIHQNTLKQIERYPLKLEDSSFFTTSTRRLKSKIKNFLKRNR